MFIYLSSKMKLQMLTEPYWTNSMIETYFGVSDKVAIAIRKTAKDKHNGYCVLFDRKIKRDSVFQALGLDVNREIELNLKIEGGETNETVGC